jgi:hypothetical protein
MEARNLVLVVVILSTLALGAAACGGTSGKSKNDAAQQRAAEAHWRTGLLEWKRSTQHALNGISILFATQASLDSIRREGSASSATLVGFEHTLGRCSETIQALGPVPEVFATAGRYARRACNSLEKGEHAVEGVVGTLRHGGGFDTLDPLSGAGDLLSTGQAELTTAVRALDTASA